MDMKERYEFCKKIESYAQMVAACLAEQMKVGQQIACERVLEHLGIVIEMMLDEIAPQDTAVILVPESRRLPEPRQPPHAAHDFSGFFIEHPSSPG
jgi:hypothetical protein